MPHRKLLVADDSLTIQKVIRLALSSSAASGGDSYEIQAVSDGDSALQQLSLFRPEIVLIDVNLPGKNAVELKREVDSYGDEFRNLRFVLLSSAFEKLDEASIEAAGFQYRLSKPFDPAHLRQVLGTVGATLSAAPQAPEAPSSSLADLPPPVPTPAPLPPALEINLAPPHIRAQVSAEESPPPMVHLALPADDYSGSDEDIKELTRETLRQVPCFDLLTEVRQPTLDTQATESTPIQESIELAESDSEWSIQERATLAPSPTVTSSPSRAREVPETPRYETSEPTLPPLESDVLMDFGGSDFPLIREIRNQLGPQTLSPDLNRDESLTLDLGIRGISPQNQPLPPPPVHSDIGVAPLTVEQMEAILAKQLESSIQEMARKLLPDLAERIIKEEIHRMLQQQP